MTFEIEGKVLLRYTENMAEEEVTIPEGIEEIAYKAFDSCHFLREVHLPDGLKKIGKKAFYHCFMMERINIPDTVTEIEESAFYYCESLKELQLPENLQFIGDYAFAGCMTIEELRIPPLIEEINRGLFSECVNLKRIIIPEGVKCIESYAFMECRNLKSLKLPESLEVIESNLSRLCGIKEITIPENVVRIGMSAFSECYSLEKIFILNPLAQIERGAFRRDQRIYFHRNGRYFIIQMKEPWLHTAREKELASFLKKLTLGKFRDLKMKEYKRAIAIGFYDLIPQIRQYLMKCIEKAIEPLIDEKQLETIEILLNDGIITERTIDPIIEYAIQSAQKSGSFEIQTMLINYKAEHFGFEDIAQRLKL